MNYTQKRKQFYHQKLKLGYFHLKNLQKCVCKIIVLIIWIKFL